MFLVNVEKLKRFKVDKDVEFTLKLKNLKPKMNGQLNYRFNILGNDEEVYRPIRGIHYSADYIENNECHTLIDKVSQFENNIDIEDYLRKIIKKYKSRPY